jgi:hypothetical protein
MASPKPRRRVVPRGWLENIPVAFAEIHCQPPSLLLELGSPRGLAYSSFCPAVDSLQLPTQCYAVDSRKGDVHSWF